ncbi:FkbP-type 22 kDa peptidyl-prolyl cis-trans isomerase [Escherichia coli]|uniref:FkbP-type 22 kDa peptidyl-prolyl cis-trans isomerase n=1 Tax=Escherichia coli TaxID=562 RepID=A0A377DYD3_ECOLX|nr:FkbP-type 22 kDa peptidyl-prolyl cis-trans isomerase [Escherichia coli]
MTTPTFDTIEAQASYGIGLQVGQQLSESGLQGLLPEALVAGIADALEGKHPAVPVDVVHRALREIHETRRCRSSSAFPGDGCRRCEIS